MLSLQGLWSVLWWLSIATLTLAALKLFIKGTYREYPVFFSYLGLQALTSTIEFILSYRSYRTYFLFYWTSDAVIVLISFAVLFEVMRHLLRSYGSLRPQARAALYAGSAITLALAILILALQPKSSERTLIVMILLREQLARIAQVGLLAVMFILAMFFRLRWKQLAFGISLGLGLYASVYLAAVSMREYFGAGQADLFSLLLSIAYNVAVLIWLSYLFQPEAAPTAARSSPQRAEFKLAEWNRALGGLLRR